MKKKILRSLLAIFLVGLTANVFAASFGNDFIGNDEWFQQGTNDGFEVNIFPNPNNGKFDILTNADGETKEVVIYNIIGDEVFHKKFEETSLKMDLTQLEKGLYMVQIYNSARDKKVTKRFYIE